MTLAPVVDPDSCSGPVGSGGPGAKPLVHSLASIVMREATGERATVRERLDRYAKGIRSVEIIAAQVFQHDGRRAEKMHQCSRTLFFHDHGEAGAKLVAGYYCQQWKLCRVCAMRRAVRTLGVLLPKVHKRMMESGARRAFLVTLTTLNGADCGERFTHLQDSNRRMMDRVRKAKQRRAVGEPIEYEAQKAVGIYSASEATVNAKTQEWHWHQHQIWITDGDRPSVEMLKAEWYAITGDSFIVHVKELKASARRAFHPDQPMSEEALCRDLVEVCKYPLKPQELRPCDAWTVQASTAGRHFTRTYGALRFDAAETAAIEAETADAGELPGEFKPRVFQWRRYGSYWIELVGEQRNNFDAPLRQLGARAVNAACERRYWSASAGSGRHLDTGVKIGTDSSQSHGEAGRVNRSTGQTGGVDPPRSRPPPGVRMKSHPSPSEDCFS